jgi:tRNA dimethylallyltransferase
MLTDDMRGKEQEAGAQAMWVRPELWPVLLAGPTAVGKSAIALALAEKIGGEIISVDSMQVYRGMDVGTAKPSRKDQERVPHHLIDILDLGESFDASQFVTRARRAVHDIQSRGRVPILCGGTGLYFKAFLEGLVRTPPSNPQLREELRATPLAELLRQLEERDPEEFQRIDRRNPRRVLRALEIVRLTGGPLSAWRAAQEDWPPVCPPRSVRRFGCFTRAREDLRARIERRVDEMFRSGLVAETERLLAAGLAHNLTAMQALGYRQVVEHLAGSRDLASTRELAKSRTRQFARRQLTWFRRQARPDWIELAPEQAPAETAANFLLAAADSSR